MLILTNLAWVRNPYQPEQKFKPNPVMLRDAMFNYTRIQTRRSLSEQEVLEINYITKRRALRYVAAADREWLYPEQRLPSTHWSKFGRGYLMMPEPRGMNMGGEIWVGYKDGSSAGFGEYGHRPGQPGFKDEKRFRAEAKVVSPSWCKRWISRPPTPNSCRSLRRATYPPLLHHDGGHDLVLGFRILGFPCGGRWFRRHRRCSPRMP